MVAYSFDKRFIPPIWAGTKRQTIRGERQRHVRQDETLQLYTAMRTKYCQLIGEARCLSISRIEIDFERHPHVSYQSRDGTTTIFPAGLDSFAFGDGFANWDEMRVFWAKHHPGVTVFVGQLIRWTDFRTRCDVYGCSPVPLHPDRSACSSAVGNPCLQDPRRSL